MKKYKNGIIIPFVSLVILFLSACSSSPTRVTSDIQKHEDGFPVHGNFCGPNIPSVNTSDMNKWIKSLSKLRPHDKLDETCKTHDICYAKHGYNDLECDKEFIKSINKLDSDEYSISCLALASAMSGYFIATNPSGIELEKYVDNMVLNPMFQGAYNYTSAGVYFYKAYTSFAILFYSPVLLLGGVSPSEIGELMAMPFEGDNKDFSGYPERYDTCGSIK